MGAQRLPQLHRLQGGAATRRGNGYGYSYSYKMVTKKVFIDIVMSEIPD